MPMQNFRLDHPDLLAIGGGLSRPECVLTTASGDLYVSDARGGVTRIASDGTVTPFHGTTNDGLPLGANGFAMLADGSFLIAPLAGGGVYRMQRDGRSEMHLDRADGRALDCPNFVLLDPHDRLWICCLTQQDRRTLSHYPRDLRDGFIVLADRRGARIVAEGIGFPNEVRLDPTGRYLYTNETLAARLLRFPIRPDGNLGAMEVVAEFDESNMFDGFTLDSAGGAWITTLVSNRLWYVAPNGKISLLIEDANPGQLARLTALQKSTGVERGILYEEHGSRLRNISSIAFGGPDLRIVYLGSLMGESILSFRAPIAGMKPAHWDFGPF